MKVKIVFYIEIFILPRKIVQKAETCKILFQYRISEYLHMFQSLFYLTIALHVSGIIITHFQRHKTTVTTASGNRYTVLSSVAFVEELEQI
jgi:hypothetical protein